VSVDPSEGIEHAGARIHLWTDFGAVGPIAIATRTGGTVVVVTRHGPHRESNEDGALVVCREDATLIAVADGMGGMNAGEVASRITLERVAERFAEAESSEALRHAVVDGLEAANAEIVESRLGAGTTFVGLIVENDVARTIHVGDSEAYHLGRRGRLKARTLPHSPVGYELEAGHIDEEEAMVHAERHLLTNHVGMLGMRIELGAATPCAPFDRFLVGTDGLLDNLMRDEIVERACTNDEFEAARRLLDDATARMASPRGEPGKPDDLTFALYVRAREQDADKG
jgi:PPM family protein phosphatase